MYLYAHCRKSWHSILLVILLIIVFGLGIGILVGYCCMCEEQERYVGCVLIQLLVC